MATISGSILNFSGIESPTNAAGRKIPLQIHNHKTKRFSKFHFGTAIASTKFENHQKPYFLSLSSARTHTLSAGRNYELNYNDDPRTEPFWIKMIQEAIRTTRSLLQFLVEQPSQLKYVEWPSFQSTLKTASLTLVLVAFLIVALSSVDSALSYVLALLLRRKA